VSLKAFLNQRAVNIVCAGSYTLPRWFDAQGRPRTFACRTTRVSPFRMVVEGPVTGKLGDRVTAYFKDFGQFDGQISDVMQGSFLLEIEMSRAMRAKMSEKLTWLEKRQKDPTIPEARQDARFIPQTSHTTLILADGTVHACFIIDMSVSGVAVSAEVQPPIGVPLAVGACVGRVVRLLPDGFATQFMEKQDLKDLMRLLTRNPVDFNPGARLTVAS
jgi:hypothetical protein